MTNHVKRLLVCRDADSSSGVQVAVPEEIADGFGALCAPDGLELPEFLDFCTASAPVRATKKMWNEIKNLPKLEPFGHGPKLHAFTSIDELARLAVFVDYLCPQDDVLCHIDLLYKAVARRAVALCKEEQDLAGDGGRLSWLLSAEDMPPELRGQGIVVTTNAESGAQNFKQSVFVVQRAWTADKTRHANVFEVLIRLRNTPAAAASSCSIYCWELVGFLCGSPIQFVAAEDVALMRQVLGHFDDVDKKKKAQRRSMGVGVPFRAFIDGQLVRSIWTTRDAVKLAATPYGAAISKLGDALMSASSSGGVANAIVDRSFSLLFTNSALSGKFRVMRGADKRLPSCERPAASKEAQSAFAAVVGPMLDSSAAAPTGFRVGFLPEKADLKFTALPMTVSFFTPVAAPRRSAAANKKKSTCWVCNRGIDSDVMLGPSCRTLLLETVGAMEADGMIDKATAEQLATETLLLDPAAFMKHMADAGVPDAIDIIRQRIKDENIDDDPFPTAEDEDFIDDDESGDDDDDSDGKADDSYDKAGADEQELGADDMVASDEAEEYSEHSELTESSASSEDEDDDEDDDSEEEERFVAKSGRHGKRTQRGGDSGRATRSSQKKRK